jgi:hypothetical protein
VSLIAADHVDVDVDLDLVVDVVVDGDGAVDVASTFVVDTTVRR